MPVAFRDCSFGYRRGQVVLDRLSFEFPAGRTVLLGPNGAGKSTMLALAASALTPNGGEVGFGELRTSQRRDRAAYRRRIGWLPQQVRPIAGLSAREQVAYAGWLKGLSRTQAWDRAPAALGLVGLEELAGKRAGELSGGQLRRLGVAQTLVHEAEVILMDEPTAGMDPVQRGVFRDVVLDVSDRAHVIVSTHQTEDLTEAYTNVVVLQHGQIRFTGLVADFLDRVGPEVPAERRAEAAYGQTITAEA